MNDCWNILVLRTLPRSNARSTWLWQLYVSMVSNPLIKLMTADNMRWWQSAERTLPLFNTTASVRVRHLIVPLSECTQLETRWCGCLEKAWVCERRELGVFSMRMLSPPPPPFLFSKRYVPRVTQIAENKQANLEKKCVHHLSKCSNRCGYT